MIDQIKEIAIKIYANSKGSHDLDHTMRVYEMCKIIGHKENADMDIVLSAALLHDIGRTIENLSKSEQCHASLGAEMAKNILIENEYDNAFIDKVCSCIECHRYRKGRNPISIEEKVLFDSDKLDSIGAIGIGRAFVFAGECNARVHNPNIDLDISKQYSKEDTAYREYLVKLRYVKDKMYTETGKRYANERSKFMETFFNRLNREVSGEI